MCLNSLASKLSCGPDNIPNVFLKKLSKVISTPLALLFKKSIECSKIPQIWKHANVIPVFKGKGRKFDVSNYRPISLALNICKVMESIVHKHIIKHCDKHKLLSNVQHGFRQQYSATSNLLELLNDVTQDIDNNNNVDLITIDFSKAFDFISHSKLIHKLYSYGIQGKLINWIKEFLKNRTFSVLINNINSVIFSVISLVPQGSKTGPLFYILCANDLAYIFKFAKLKMYADDLSIYAAVNNYKDYLKLQYDLNELCKWAERWCLNINYDKCKVIHFGHANKAFNYKLNDILIKSSNNEKTLGVVIDSNLSFKEHIYACVKKGYGISNIISTNLRNLQRNTLVNLYKCYVRPTLEYNSVIFSPHNIFLIDTLENVQRHFTKHLPGLYNFEYVERLKFVNLNL